eukprot:2333728-Rhodomonas_salina.1
MLVCNARYIRARCRMRCGGALRRGVRGATGAETDSDNPTDRLTRCQAEYQRRTGVVLSLCASTYADSAAVYGIHVGI